MGDVVMTQALGNAGIAASGHGFRLEPPRLFGGTDAHAVMESALAHTVKDKAEAAYARSDLFDKRRALMEAWAQYLMGDQPTSRANGRAMYSQVRNAFLSCPSMPDRQSTLTIMRS